LTRPPKGSCAQQSRGSADGLNKLFKSVDVDLRRQSWSVSTRRDAEIRIQAMQLFDFNVEAELFPPRNRKFAGRQYRYRRFATAADAIRFAVEVLPGEVLSGAIIEAGEERCDAKEIRRLYESADYPLPRNGAARTAAA
jgi:hypothetical protein